MNPPVSIYASVMCADLWNLGGTLSYLKEIGIDGIHFDVMDGSFVPSLFSLGPKAVEMMVEQTGLPVDVHLMVRNPESMACDFAKAGASSVSFHIEATNQPFRLIQMLKETKTRVGMALNPATPVDTISYFIEELDLVLVMTVEPGFAGQRLIPITVAKVREIARLIRSSGQNMAIEVDGNLAPSTIPDLMAAGANILVGGSSGLFRRDLSITEALGTMRQASIPLFGGKIKNVASPNG